MINCRAALSKEGMIAFLCIISIAASARIAWTAPLKTDAAVTFANQIPVPKLSPLQPIFSLDSVNKPQINDRGLKKSQAAMNIQPKMKPTAAPSSTSRKAAPIQPAASNNLGKPLFSASNADNGYAYFRRGSKPQKQDTPKSAPPSVTWKSAFGLIIRLCIVAVFAYVCLLGLKWVLTRQKVSSALDSKNLSMAGTLSIGANRSVHVVRAGGREFLIGATGDNITLLADLGLVELNSEQPAETESFRSILTSISSENNSSLVNSVAGKISDAASLLRNKAEQLQRTTTAGGNE